jgi:quercetin dioxygenase-like cupin family protein
MKLEFILALLIGSLVQLAQAGEALPAAVIHIDHAKVAAGGTLVQTNNFKVMVFHRDRAGEAEIHERDTDIFHVEEGSATFVTGGKVANPRAEAAGEFRGKEIIGGEEHHLVKGDVIVIPRGVPHWFKEVKAPIDYFVVKVSK